MIDQQDIRRLYETTSEEVLNQPKYAELRPLIDFSRMQLEQLLGEDYEIKSTDDLYELCARIDAVLAERRKPRKRPNIHPALPVIKQIRAEVGHALIELMYKRELRRLPNGAMEDRLELDKEKQLAQLVFSLVPHARADETGAPISPEWIRLKDKIAHQRITQLILDPVRQEHHWESIRSLFPPDIRPRVRLYRESNLPSEAFMDRVREYSLICETMGPEALADFMVARHPDEAKDFNYSVRIISQYLGRTIQRPLEPKDLGAITPEMLGVSGLRDVVEFHLKRYVYRDLIRTYGDSGIPLETYEKRLNVVDSEIKEALSKVLKEDSALHMDLLNDVVSYFKKLFKLRIPKNLNRQIEVEERDEMGRIIYEEDEHGERRPKMKLIPFPSLRQMMAMERIGRKGAKPLLVNFFMGRGKTATSFLCKEHLKAKKMLFVCSNGAGMARTVEKQVRKHYHQDRQPSVGIIESGMNQDQIAKAMKKDIVITPYSMLNAKGSGLPKGKDEAETKRIREEAKTIEERLRTEVEFDFLAVDEVQNAKNIESDRSQSIHRLAAMETLKGTVLLSGNPVPNSPADMLSHLSIYDPEKFQAFVKEEDKKGEDNPLLGGKKTKALRKWLSEHDPLVLRSCLLDFVLNPDEPENWQRHLDVEKYQLGPIQQAGYNVIWNTEMLPTKKMHAFHKVLIDSEPFMGPNEEILLELISDNILSALDEENAFVLAQDHYRAGILDRDHKNYPNTPSFAEKLEAKLKEEHGDDLIFHVIHGDVTGYAEADKVHPSGERMTKREWYIDQACNPPPGKKVVIFSQLEAVAEGINLSSIKHAGVTTPPMRMADMAQFVMRFAREGNLEAKMHVAIAEGSLAEAIWLHSLRKYMLTCRLLEGGTLTEDDLRSLSDWEWLDHIKFRDGKPYVEGADLSDAVRNRLQSLEFNHQYLHGKGESASADFIASEGWKYAENYTHRWELGLSANNARFVSALTAKLKREGEFTGDRYADVACGNLTFQNTYGVEHPEAEIHSFDLNPDLMEKGKELLQRRDPRANLNPKTSVCSMMNLDAEDESFDFLNCNFALQFLSQRAQTNYHNSERARALIEFNRVLTEGGVMVLTLPQNACEEEEFEAFKKEMPNFGFDVLEEYTGDVRPGRKKENTPFSRVLTLRKVDEPQYRGINPKALNLHLNNKAPGLSPEERDSSHHMSFNLNGTGLRYRSDLTQTDLSKEELAYQERIAKARKALKKMYDGNHQTFKDFNENCHVELRQEGLIATPTDPTRPEDCEWVFSFIQDDYAPKSSYSIF